jgi:2-polyprenyl-3-methyl-5-hydroxy-6-metoxy-1,4-benzoquinol methylase
MSVAYAVNRLVRPLGYQVIRANTLDRLLAAAARQPIAAPPEPEPDANIPSGWEDPLKVLRKKWSEIPAGDRRQASRELLRRSDSEIVSEWERARKNDVEGAGFSIRGWYHELYRSMMLGKRLLDVGCGMGLSTLPFAEMGAHVIFTDIIPENVELVRRLCRIKGISADFLVVYRFEDLDRLPDVDVVTAIGSLMYAPLAITHAEVTLLKTHLRPGGRWLHLAYPRSRWEQEGKTSFAEWGEQTDGPGTPWMEYHDRSKMLWLFEPSEIRILFECEWHDRAYNWFDIELVHH